MHKMNLKSYLLSTIACIATYLFLDFIIHGNILMPFYDAHTAAGMYRADMDSWMWLFLIIPVFVMPELNGLYAKVAHKHTPGIATLMALSIGFMITFTSVVASFASMNITLTFAAAWFVMQMVQFGLVGLVMGYIYKD